MIVDCQDIIDILIIYITVFFFKVRARFYILPRKTLLTDCASYEYNNPFVQIEATTVVYCRERLCKRISNTTCMSCLL
jgi:hypothetical protein